MLYYGETYFSIFFIVVNTPVQLFKEPSSMFPLKIADRTTDFHNILPSEIGHASDNGYVC